MSKTTEKLSEAEFFLKQVEAHYLDNPAFDYFLSAFISSARSVLWIMRSEYNNIEGWESWYQALKPSTDSEELLRKINAARIRTEKQSPVKTNFRANFIISKEQITEQLRQEFENSTGKIFEFSVRPMNDQDITSEVRLRDDPLSFLGKVENVYRVLDELDDNDVLVVCREYYATIQEVVRECERLFG